MQSMQVRAQEIETIRLKYEAVRDCLTEKGRRLWAAAEALSYGHGGVLLVNKATKIARTTIHRGIEQVRNPVVKTGIRKLGGGRKKISQEQTQIIEALDRLVEPTSRGDPETRLRWSCKSTRNLTKALETQGYHVSHSTIATLLHELEYSLQANKKTREGKSHPDRDGQFRYINASAVFLQNKGQPVISVDTKKKEMIGNYKNGGREFCKKGRPIEVNTHDFPDKKLGKVVPYGIYDIGKNKGWVSVGISSDTAEFAVNTIRTWWYQMGKPIYPQAKELLITADCGGSNGYRVRLWKYELQHFANESGLAIHVRHFPPGTSKWNKIEHRLFSYISKNWRGKPLISRETVVNLIANTETNKGLEVRAVLDENEYVTGKDVSEEDIEKLSIRGDEFHPEWNYTISPNFREKM